MKMKVLRNEALFQTLEKFQVLYICIFFQFFQVYSINLAFFLEKKNPGL